MFNNDYKAIRKAIERLTYLRREIECFSDTKAISGLLARVSYRLEDILTDVENDIYPIRKSDIKDEFDYICTWRDYLVKASLLETEYPEIEYLERARIELRNTLNVLGL